MIDIVLAIAAWCSAGTFKATCRQEILSCVVKDSKDGDGKEFYEKQLKKCLLEGKK